MPGADLLFLPLPFAHAARGSGPAPVADDAAFVSVSAAKPRRSFEARIPAGFATIKATALRLGVPESRVRKALGVRWPDAIRFQRRWIIPVDASLPNDPEAVAETWQRIAGERGRALRRIAELGDVAAGGLTPGDGRNARLIPGTDPARVSVVADAWNAYRMATVDAGAQVMLDEREGERCSQ